MTTATGEKVLILRYGEPRKAKFGFQYSVEVQLEDGTKHWASSFKKIPNIPLGEEVVAHFTRNGKYLNIANPETDLVYEGEVLGTGEVTDATETKAAAPKKRTRKAKVKDREDFRGEAVESVKANLQSAIELAKEFKTVGAESVDLVALADLVGRTISALHINDSKDRRMKEIRGE